MIDLSYTQVVNGNALDLPLPDESVDLIITSPPYFALRSYRDGGEHYDGQIGSEPTPQDFLEALWAATAEMKRVLKPSGSIWVNLGDKYAGSGGHNNNGLGQSSLGAAKGEGSRLAAVAYAEKMKARANLAEATRRNAPDRYNQNSGGIQAKSLMGLPWRYAIGCIDQLGLILRAEVIWSKPNGLPESVTDRVRRSHEQWFHFTKQGRYFAAVDEVREAHNDHAGPVSRFGQTGSEGGNKGGTKHNDYDAHRGAFPLAEGGRTYNPLGKLPGSVWTIPSEPLRIPDDVKAAKNLPDHFAAFPSAWPVRIISGWSPSGICTACDEPRRPVVDKHYLSVGDKFAGGTAIAGRHDSGKRMGDGVEATITGYACGCGSVWGPNDVQPSTHPAVVLDPFGGTGTVAMVAKQLGRIGISVDLSADYCRLAEWRIFESGHGEHAIAKQIEEGELDPADVPVETLVRAGLLPQAESLF